MSAYDLGPLAGNSWYQYSNSAGQVFYQSAVTHATQYNIPAGWEDDIQVYSLRNQRTGRLVLIDPHPPAAQTYLDVLAVQTHLSTVERTPDSPEFLYRRAMNAILKWLFPESEGYDVVQEEHRGVRPDFVVFKICCRPGGSRYAYDFCIVESKCAGQPWGSTEDQCAIQCDALENDMEELYAIVQIGMQVAFYKFDNGSFSRMSGKFHLRHDVERVMEWANYMKNNPLPVVAS